MREGGDKKGKEENREGGWWSNCGALFVMLLPFKAQRHKTMLSCQFGHHKDTSLLSSSSRHQRLKTAAITMGITIKGRAQNPFAMH